jgi:Domain of unknown function (DUF6371)
MTHHHEDYKDCELSVAEIALRLGRCKKAGKGFLCCCPTHDDRQASLSLDENKKGQLLVHCLAGCSQETVVEALKGLNLWRYGSSKRGQARVAQAPAAQKGVCVCPIPDDASRPPERHPARGDPVNFWTYRDALGAVCFHICRFDADGSKSFSPLSLWRYPSGRMGWDWCAVPGDDRPLYGLHELAARPNAPVWIFEGEKCADAGALINPEAVCVTSAGGAAAVHKTDWRPLRGRDVVLWGDLNPAGQGYIKAIAKILNQPVDMVDAAELAKINPAGGSRAAPLKFDAAFAVEEGWQVEALAECAMKLVRPFTAPEAKGKTGPGDAAGVPPSGTATPPEEDDDRPTIKIKTGEAPRIIDELDAAIIESKIGLYQRGGLIVRVADIELLGADEKKTTALGIVEQCEHTLWEDAEASAIFTRFDLKQKKWVSCDPPMLYVKAWIGRGGRSRLPILSGPISSPLILPSGRIIETTGYDAGTGFYFDPLGTKFKPVPQKPSRQDAEDALDLLDGLLAEFPFETEKGKNEKGEEIIVSCISQSVAISGLVTAVMRRALDFAPLFGISAPSFGSGKSYLIDVFCTIATGRPAPVLDFGGDEKEFAKRLDALLLEGIGFIAIDNIDRQLASAELATTLSQKEKKCRVLGVSKMPIVSTDAFISATGKNLTIVKDLRRRTLFCSLDAKIENPEERQFTQNPLALIREDRGKFVVAALTIVQAYIAAGRPNPGKPLANYERWCRMVRDPLVWLGLPDPVKSQEKTKTEDPNREKQLAVMQGWWRNCKDRGHTLSRVIELAEETGDDGKWKDKDFHAALIAVAVGKQPGRIDHERLGTWMRTNKGDPIGKYRFEKVTGHKPIWWVLEKLKKDEGA